MKFNLNTEKPWITKQAILKTYTDLNVYRKYIDFDFEIGGKPILSPLRNEKTPSFGFFIGETNEICFNDFKLDAKGDFVTFVMLKFGLTYFEALSKIACDFDLDKDYICKKFNKIISTSTSNISREELVSRATVFHVGKKKRNWLIHDITFWEQYGISINTLEYFNVEPISHIFIKDLIYPADKYAYCFIEKKDKKETYKIYQPYNKDYKWINNHDNSVWQGWDKLPDKGADLIITKSLKDVMSLYEVADLPAVSLQSENVLPKPYIFDILKNRFTDIYVLYDNDYDSDINWGRNFSDRLVNELGSVIQIEIEDQYKSKDFSDLVKNYGRKTSKEILFTNLIPF